MRNKLIFVAFLIFFNLISCLIVSAEDLTCDYNNGLKIYYKNGIVDYDYKDMTEKWFREGNTILWDMGIDKMYEKEDIEIKQEYLKEQLGNYRCPGVVYLCEETKWGVELPSLWNLLNTIGAAGDSIVQVLSLGFINMEDSFNEHVDKAYSLFHFGEGNLIIMSEKTYNDDYKDNLGGSLDSVIIDYANDGAEYCTLGDGVPFIEGTIDVVCGLGAFVGEGIWDLISSNDKTLVGYKDLTCHSVNYPKDGPYQPININCTVVDTEYLILTKDINEYKACDKDDSECRLSKKITINKSAERLRKLCNNLLSNFTYSGSEVDCIKKCLSINDKLNEIDDTVKIESCGFSSRLLIFIGNIIKWLKYIAPVFIMVLSIIDFIKAIVNDKEDEMKKAQKRFIIRLVVAVLIFIIPFIIEFILNVFGFDKYIDGCGIFDI